MSTMATAARAGRSSVGKPMMRSTPAQRSSYLGHASRRNMSVTPPPRRHNQSHSTCVYTHSHRRALVVQRATSPNSTSAVKVDALSIRAMSDDDLGSMLEEANRKLLAMRFSQATMQSSFSKGAYRETKKTIARILTVRREREIEVGVSVRESRYRKKLASRKTGIALKNAQRGRYQIPGKKNQAPNKRAVRREAYEARIQAKKSKDSNQELDLPSQSKMDEN